MPVSVLAWIRAALAVVSRAAKKLVHFKKRRDAALGKSVPKRSNKGSRAEQVLRTLAGGQPAAGAIKTLFENLEHRYLAAGIFKREGVKLWLREEQVQAGLVRLHEESETLQGDERQEWNPGVEPW